MSIGGADVDDWTLSSGTTTEVSSSFASLLTS